MVVVGCKYGSLKMFKTNVDIRLYFFNCEFRHPFHIFPGCCFEFMHYGCRHLVYVYEL